MLRALREGEEAACVDPGRRRSTAMTGSSRRCAMTTSPELRPHRQRTEEADAAPARREHEFPRAHRRARRRTPRAGAMRQRVPHEVGVAAERGGSGSPRNVPNASRKMRSASEQILVAKRRTVGRHERDSCDAGCRTSSARLQRAIRRPYGVGAMSRAGRLVVDRAGVQRSGRVCPRRFSTRPRRCRASPRSSEIIVVDDGSRDDTAAVAERFASAVPLRVIRLPENRGKGAAVAAGHRGSAPSVRRVHRRRLSRTTSSGCVRCSPPCRQDETDVAIGARELAESEINRGYGALRLLSGRTLSVLTSLALGLPFRDSQCGLKAFRADVAHRLFAHAHHRRVRLRLRDPDRRAAQRLPRPALSRPAHPQRRLAHPARTRQPADGARSLARPPEAPRRTLFSPTTWRRARRGRARSAAATRTHRRWRGHGYRMVECRGCGLWYLNPMPTAATLARLYDEGVLHEPRRHDDGLQRLRRHGGRRARHVPTPARARRAPRRERPHPRRRRGLRLPHRSRGDALSRALGRRALGRGGGARRHASPRRPRHVGAGGRTRALLRRRQHAGLPRALSRTRWGRSRRRGPRCGRAARCSR